MSVDLSVIVTAHGEGIELHATLRNVPAGEKYAHANGISTEIILVVDKPTAATAAYVADTGRQLLAGTKHTVLNVENGDPGLSRMSGARAATGRYVALVDGDNLFNETWLARAVAHLREKPANYVAHPGFIVTFGERTSVRIVPSMDLPRFGYGDLLNENPWDTAAVMERTLLLEHPYRDFPLESQLGPEDWLWNIETVLAGVRHVPVPETVMFYRAKSLEASVNERRQARGALLPPCDIGALATLLGPGTQSALHQRHRSSRRFFSRIYASLGPVRRFITRFLPGLSRALYLLARRTYVFLTGITVDELVTSATQLSRRALAFLERERISLGHYEPTLAFLAPIPLLPRWRIEHPDYAELLVTAVAEIGPGVTHVVAVPWLGIGGADLISQSYAQGFADISGNPQQVVMLAERGNVYRHPGLAGDIRVVTLGDAAKALPDFLRTRLVSEVLLQIQPQRVHIVNSPRAYAAMRTFDRALGDSIRFTAAAFCVDRTDDGIPAGYLLWNSARYMPALRAVYCDNQQVAHDLHQLGGFPEDIFSVHYQPSYVGRQRGEDGTPESRVIHEGLDHAGTKDLTVLWAARLDRQKNVDTLIEISQEIARRKLPIQLHIYGSRVLDTRSARITRDLGRGSIFHGDFKGGLSAIAPDYDVFLMTSLWEGMPLTLLEATRKGMPIVAPNVGGISEFIENGVSGLIVEDPTNVDGYIEALLALRDDVVSRGNLVAAARARAATQHSWENFVATLAKSEKQLVTSKGQRGVTPSKT